MSIVDIAAIVTSALSGGCILLFLIARPRRGYSPLVEPAPDAFPIRYHDPYVPPQSLEEEYAAFTKFTRTIPGMPPLLGPCQKGGQSNEALLALMKQLEERAPSALAGIPYQPAPEELRLDLRLIYHQGMKQGTSMADCQCRSCRKARVRLFAEGKITAEEVSGITLQDAGEALAARFTIPPQQLGVFTVEAATGEVKQEPPETTWEGEELAYE